jgi:hypothetical protein
MFLKTITNEIREKRVRKKTKKRSATNDRMERPLQTARVNLPLLENSTFMVIVSCISQDDNTTIQKEFSASYTHVKLWKELLTIISKNGGLSVSEKPFTLTAQFKCMSSDDVLDDKYMGRYKNGQVIRTALIHQVSNNASLSKAFQLRNHVKLFLIELHMAGQGSEHVIGLVFTR